MVDKEDCQYLKIIKNTWQWSKDLEQCFWKACKFMEVCGKNDIILKGHPDEFQFGVDMVLFVEFGVIPSN